EVGYKPCRDPPFFLYSQPKNPFFQASANPCFPPSFLTRRSVVNVNPLGSTAPGLGCFRTSQRSRKCSCEADRSVRRFFRHLSTKAAASMIHDPGDRDNRAPDYTTQATDSACMLSTVTMHGAGSIRIER